MLLWPSSFLYLLLIETRNFLYNHNIIKINKYDTPIISVGNITTGGTGKTPIVMSLIALLEESYPVIAVVSRGYKRKSTGVLIVSDGMGKILDSEQGGDEPVLIARKFPYCPVLVAEKRSRGVEEALKCFTPDLIILDDAYQHRSVYRDCDIVLVHSKQKLKNDHLLPMGNLREPLKNLKRADLFIMTGLNEWENKIDEPAVKELKPLFRSITRCTGYVKTDMILQKELSNLYGKTAIAFCGIANPDNFRILLTSLGVDLIEFYTYPDHYNYRREDFVQLKSSCRQIPCDYLITTEKDLVKWMAPDEAPANLIALSIETILVENETILQKIKTNLDMKTKID
jgi:tetraacyldisaccharide 4'-kinase